MTSRTANSFGFEWSKFNDIFPEYEDNFLSYINPLSKDFFRGKIVLDAGCGAGRHAYFAAKWGADVTAFDYSVGAMRTARRNTEVGTHVNVIWANIYDMPTLWTGKFDIVMCIGVLHHLPDPEGGFRKLVECLRPGGTIVVWVYGKKDNRMAMYLYDPIRKLTTRIPHPILYWLVLPLAVVVELANRLRLPIFRYYREFPFRTKWNDAFDVFSAPSARYYDLNDIQGWFERAGLDDIVVHHRMLGEVAKGVVGVGVKQQEV